MALDNRNTIRIDLPGSKSIAARALVCRLLSGHDTKIKNLPECGDTDGMLRLAESVRKAEKSGEAVKVDIGEGGTTLRFGMAACASLPGLDITMGGSARLMARPHAVLIEALKSMGGDIRAAEDSSEALHIHGNELRGGVIELDGSISSQYLSAMMLAAPMWRDDTIFRIKRPVVSYPYITMTAGVMRDFGAHVAIEDKEDHMEVGVRADGYALCARYDVEGDWSAASYFFEARLIMESLGRERALTMPSLKAPAESLQGDSRVAAIFMEAMRRLREGEKTAMLMNLSDAPDLVPAIAVGFCLADIPFRIEGVAHLRHKESDRMDAVSTEIRKLGYLLNCGDDHMEWRGTDADRCVAEKEPLIRTYQDHRMAMAFAPARMLFPALKIENPGVVGKSFPGFWQEMEKYIGSSTLDIN